jgi:gamma-glutamyltranspeptidase/glutathione hydrolase
MTAPFRTVKQEVVAARAVVAANHPLAAAAGLETLAQGGNAVDAAVATLAALTVVEPMMVSIFGAGFVLHRTPAGALVALDNYATAPAAARPDMFEPVPGSLENETVGRRNRVGHLAVGVPGALRGWAALLARHGTLPLAEVLAPAIRYAETGFAVSPYLAQAIAETPELADYPASAAVFLPGGRPPAPGTRLVRRDYARTLRLIAEGGLAAMYTGEVARLVVAEMERAGGWITLADLAGYQEQWRAPVRGSYRGCEIVSMAPASSGGTHVVQILNLLEADDVRGLGFGSVEGVHRFLEALKIAFADRARYMADPDAVAVPVDWLTSKAYAAQRRREIDPARATAFTAGVAAAGGEGDCTTHVTVVDAAGGVVTATQTLNDLFGAKVTAAGTGMLLNNCMALLDPTPGRANSIAPGKRILSSMSPTIVQRDGRPWFALGTPGGSRIFAAVTQAIINVIDHGMTLQEAVEAPRVWTMGATVLVEDGFPNLAELVAGLARRGHTVEVVPKVAGGMNGVLIDEAGLLHGAACWRADGAPVGLSGGPARLAGETLPLGARSVR